METVSHLAAVLLWVAALWGLSAPWLIWWVVVRGRLPVLPFIGEPNAGPFYSRFSRRVFVALLAGSFVLGLAQVVAGVLLGQGQRTGGLLQFGLLPIEATFWYGFALPIPPVFAVIRVALVVLAWSSLTP